MPMQHLFCIYIPFTTSYASSLSLFSGNITLYLCIPAASNLVTFANFGKVIIL